MAQKLDSAQMHKYWTKTSRLMWTIFALWIVFSFVIPLFAIQLNAIKFLGFPLGFYMAAQGSLIAFVVLCFWNASAQNKIDEEFGVAGRLRRGRLNMANTNSTQGGFLGNLGKIYGGYTGGFIVFTLILAILEQMGVSNKIIGYCFVFLTIGVYAYIGILSRTMDLSEYYVAGRKVPAFYNGMATGADWMSAASFISMAGGLYLGGFNAAWATCWAGPAATCWSASCSHPTCASSASSPCPTSSARATRATPRGCAAWSCCSRVVHLHRRAVLRHRHHHLALPRHRRSRSRSSSACSASWCARCWAACAR